MRAQPSIKSAAQWPPLLGLLGLIGIVGILGPTVAAAGSSAYGASFISNPGIYAYSVANQQAPKDNDIKFASTATADAGAQSPGDSNLNRNYYYTNNNPETLGEGLPAAPPTQPAPQTGCTLDRLAVYKVVLHTYWTRELFPKHYPDWRPTAQWTKTLGRTHNSNYALYHIGQPATGAVKQFTETGRTDLLDSSVGEQQQQQMQLQSQTGKSQPGRSTATAPSTGASAATAFTASERSVFDEFSLPAIQLGAGRSEAKVFVDSNHSMVSLMTRIVPSPDWFIGVDSFELCVGGSWIDTVTVELDPLDAGTDNGFTFTAPNWPTAPQGVIYRITSRYPGHPAGSFYYPKSKRLPPIATFQFIKLKEYELSEVFNIAEDDRKYETVQTQTHLDAEHSHVEMNNELSASIERERQTEQQQEQQQQEPQQQQQQQKLQQLQPFNDERQRIRSQLLAKMNPIYSGDGSNNSQQPPQLGQVLVPKNDKHAILQSIASSYRRATDAATNNISANLTASSATSAVSALQSQTQTQTQTQSLSQSQSPVGRGNLSRRRSQSQRRRDCRVSHWSEWTACSKSCGIGEMHRYRKVIKHGKRGGRPCPALQQSKWCGTERNCHEPQTYFNWSDSDT
ncbi:uncharacterized protein LOC117581537 [Drosophila guanche]|uniref:Blast:Spondin-2 n=1 Tax=Drosophila guanche TaxID=7266 RepID=A0A3B0JNW9_DROGU|nr:uncharacterized protein LOC117581537 [Drosophila guanche]SPP75279.1 blast:Spondin-2 [Drosophila guanche]